ncbi:hypothetical protein AAKU55_002325 [Oxalobacteraceae bacterium GrIS 1.11]
MSRILLSALFLLSQGCAAASLPDARDGDLIFQESRSAQSLAVQRATASPYSHMGIVLYRSGQPYVFEAVATVRYTPLAQWIARGQGGRFVLKRLAKPLSAAQQASLRGAAPAFEGKPYDLTFEWSDSRIYCSELVWKMYARALGIHLGELQKLREFKLDDPAVRAKLRERYGSAIPMEEPVISPVAMFASPLLRTVE